MLHPASHCHSPRLARARAMLRWVLPPMFHSNVNRTREGIRTRNNTRRRLYWTFMTYNSVGAKLTQAPSSCHRHGLRLTCTNPASYIPPLSPTLSPTSPPRDFRAHVTAGTKERKEKKETKEKCRMHGEPAAAAGGGKRRKKAAAAAAAAADDGNAEEDEGTDEVVGKASASAPAPAPALASASTSSGGGTSGGSRATMKMKKFAVAPLKPPG